MDGKWRGICGLSGLLTLFAAFSTSLADEESEFLAPANSNKEAGEFCEGYFDDNNNYHIGFQCTSTERNPDATYCCGSATNKYCCDQGPYIGSLNIGALVGIFVGVFAAVSLCIILCCCFCSCCLCTRDRTYVGRPHRRAARLIPRDGFRATLMRVRRKRRAPPTPEDASSRSGSSSQPQSPPRASYPPQSYPSNQQYPPQRQQYPLRQYPQHHYPHQDYPLNYPPNYPPQPYPHPVPRSVNQSYPHCEPMVPSFSAPPPPYSATSSEQHQHASPPLQDKHGPAVDELPGPAYPPPTPRPMSSDQAPPLLDKQSSSARDYPSVAYPPPSRRVAGPPSAPPPDEDYDYPRKM